MALGGGIVTGAMFLLFLGIHLATTAVEADADQVVGKVFVVFLWNLIWVLAPPMIAFVLGSSLNIIRYGAAPRWTGWLGVVVTVTLLMPWMGVPFAFVWIFIVSVKLVLRELRGKSPQSELGGQASTPAAG